MQEAWIAGASCPDARTRVFLDKTSYTLTANGTRQVSNCWVGKRASRRERNNLPASRPGPSFISQKSSRRRRLSSSRMVVADAPAAQRPPTSAPALEPEIRCGKRPASSSAVITPVCAKKPKKPDDIVTEKGASASQARSVGLVGLVEGIAASVADEDAIGTSGLHAWTTTLLALTPLAFGMSNGMNRMSNPVDTSAVRVVVRSASSARPRWPMNGTQFATCLRLVQQASGEVTRRAPGD